jgi:putative flippase GtrA
VRSSSEPAPPPPSPPRAALGAEGFRYALVAGFSFVWIMSVSALTVELVGLPERLGVAIALLTALIANFTLLRVFVFPGQTAHLGAQFAATAVTSFSFRAAEYGLFLLLVGPGGLHYLLATAVAVLTSSLGKFLVYRNLIFRRRGNLPA